MTRLALRRAEARSIAHPRTSKLRDCAARVAFFEWRARSECPPIPARTVATRPRHRRRRHPAAAGGTVRLAHRRLPGRGGGVAVGATGQPVPDRTPGGVPPVAAGRRMGRGQPPNALHRLRTGTALRQRRRTRRNTHGRGPADPHLDSRNCTVGSGAVHSDVGESLATRNANSSSRVSAGKRVRPAGGRCARPRPHLWSGIDADSRRVAPRQA